MKDKAFLKLLKEANPDYDGDSVTTKEFIDTGSYILNAAISTSLYGGFPSNRISVVHSKAGVGKSYFCMSAVKTTLDKNPDAQALYFDTEYAIDDEFLLKRDIDPDRVHVMQPDTIEDFKTISLKFLQSYQDLEPSKQKKMIMVLDSLGMLPSIKEDEDSQKGKHVRDMTKQQGVRSLFRTITQKLGKVDIPFIVASHSYTDIMSYGAPQKMSGGGGLEYAASVILALSKAKDTEEVNVKGKKVKIHDGNIITVKVDKSRFSREGRVVKTKLNFKDGIDRYYGLLPLASQYEIIKKVSTQYEMPDGSKHFEKNIVADPQKYFTKDILDKLEEAAKIHFSLGSTSHDIVLTDEAEIDSIEDDEAVDGNGVEE